MPRNQEGSAALQMPSVDEEPFELRRRAKSRIKTEQPPEIPPLAPEGKKRHIGKPRAEAERPKTPERPVDEGKVQMHLALAEAAMASAAITRGVLERGELTDENAWEYLHDLRKREIEMEEYLEEAWERKGRKNDDPEVIQLVKSISTLQGIIKEVREKVESGHVELAAREYADAFEQALGKVRDDIDRSRDIRKELVSGNVGAEQRARYLDVLEKRIETLEKELERLDRLPDEEKLLYDNTASHEAVSQAISDIRETIHELLKAEKSAQIADRVVAEEDKAVEDAEPLLNGTSDLLKQLDLQIRTSGIRENRRQSEIIRLSKIFVELEDILKILQTRRQTDESKQTIGRISEQMEEIDDMRARLHAEPKGSEEVTPYEKINADLRKRRIALRKRLSDIERQEKILEPKIKRSYGRSPDKILVQGGLGLGSNLMRGMRSFIGESDDYGEWQRLEKEADEIRSELESIAEEGSARGKAAARSVDEEMVVLRATQRTDAEDYRKAHELAPAKTEEEFFRGSLGIEDEDVRLPDLSEPQPVDESVDVDLSELNGPDPDIIASARKSKIKNPEQLWKNITENGAGALSFDANEYIELLAVFSQSRSRQGGTKNPIRFLAKIWKYGDQAMLQKMKDELREHGLDPKTGAPFTGESKRAKRERRVRESVRPKKAA